MSLQQKLIFSVYNSNYPEWKNIENHHKAIQLLNDVGIEFVNSFGAYKGIEEKNFIIDCTTINCEIVERICELFQQECFMQIVGNLAYFVSPLEVELIGELQEISESDCGNYDGFTYDSVEQKFYTIVEEKCILVRFGS